MAKSSNPSSSLCVDETVGQRAAEVGKRVSDCLDNLTRSYCDVLDTALHSALHRFETWLDNYHSDYRGSVLGHEIGRKALQSLISDATSQIERSICEALNLSTDTSANNGSQVAEDILDDCLAESAKETHDDPFNAAVKAASRNLVDRFGANTHGVADAVVKGHPNLCFLVDLFNAWCDLSNDETYVWVNPNIEDITQFFVEVVSLPERPTLFVAIRDHVFKTLIEHTLLLDMGLRSGAVSAFSRPHPLFNPTHRSLQHHAHERSEREAEGSVPDGITVTV